MYEHETQADQYPALPCSEIVYRGMRSRRWLDPTRENVLPAAFFRRPNETDGLSVNPSSECDIKYVRELLNPCHGVVSLHVGRVRDLGLEVEQDESKHACIKGLPYQDEDPLQAERLAGQLAKQARIQWLPD